MSNLVKTVAAVTIATATCIQSLAGDADMGILKSNLTVFFRDVALNAPIQPGDHVSPDEIPPLREDGTWADVDYVSRRSSDWPAKLHLKRTIRLAIDNPDEALKALRAWVRVDPQSDNWWNQSIGTPRQLCIAMLLLGDRLDAETLESLRPILARSKPGMTAQNRTWLAGIHIMKGALYGDEEAVKTGRNIIAAELHIASPGKEGIQQDYSFHQHGPQMQLGNYGLSFFREMTQWAVAFAGTEYAFPEKKLDILENYFTNAMRWALFKGTLDLHACGRQLVDEYPRAKYDSAVNGALALQRAGRIPDFKPSGVDSFAGSHYFPDSAYLIHRPAGWFFSLRMCTDRIIGSETVNNENLLGGFAGDGGYFIRTHGGEYEDALPLWNWRHYPGTTEVQNPKESLRSGKFRNGKDGAATAVSIGDSTVVGFRLRLESHRADKAWLCFPDCVVAFGCGITSDSALPVHTSVDQRLANGDAIAGGKPIADNMTAFDCPITIAHDGIEYTILDGDDVRLVREQRTGSWSRMNAAWSDAKREGDIFDLFIDHGTAPQNARYLYTIHPQVRPAPRLKRLATSAENAIAFFDETSGIALAVLFEVGSVTLSDGIVWSAEMPEVMACDVKSGMIKSMPLQSIE